MQVDGTHSLHSKKRIDPWQGAYKTTPRSVCHISIRFDIHLECIESLGPYVRHEGIPRRGYTNLKIRILLDEDSFSVCPKICLQILIGTCLKNFSLMKLAMNEFL